MTAPPLAETVASFDARAPRYDESRMHREVALLVADEAHPQPDDVLLDLAGGTGLVARAALPKLASAVVLDASLGMLRQAGAAGPRLHLVRADAHHVPLRSASVDIVTCVTALHLLADPVQALREAARVCRPGGRVLFTTWAAGGWSTGRLLRDAAAREGITIADPSLATGTPASAGDLARSSGLVVQGVTELRVSEPLPEPARVWEHVTRDRPEARTDAVRRRFGQALTGEVEHVLLLVVARPQTSSPSR